MVGIRRVFFCNVIILYSFKSVHEPRCQTEVQRSTVYFSAGSPEAGLSQSEREESRCDVPARLRLSHERTEGRSSRGILQVFRSLLSEVNTPKSPFLSFKLTSADCCLVGGINTFQGVRLEEKH